MQGILKVVVYSLASGATVLLGGLLARFIPVPRSEQGDEISHGIIAFGGGVLVAAVAFVLTPRGIKELSLPLLLLSFFLGVICFLMLDRFINSRGERTAQLMAMLMDFIPEAVALGAVFAGDEQTGLLLALFIGLQNLPESFNSYGDLTASGFSPGKAIALLAPLSLTGIAAAILGYSFLANCTVLVAALMTFSAGGILYLVFQDIAPMVRMSNHWAPATGAALGFMLGMLGEKLLGG